MRQSIALAALLTLLALGCSSDGPGPADQLRQLEEARLRWSGQAVSTYSYAFDQDCFCPPALIEPVDVSVVGGVVAAVASRPGGVPLAPADASRFHTVPELFDLIETALRSGEPVVVMADYDPASGLPTAAFIDYQSSIDEELAWTAGDLRLP
jgi:hypothetical protein